MRRRLLAGALLAVFLGCAGVLAVKGADRLAARADYRRAEDLAGVSAAVSEGAAEASPLPMPIPSRSMEEPTPEQTASPSPEPSEDPCAAALANMDLAALRQVNGEVLGWLSIPGTGVSYPLLQGTDNSYYLDHTWSGARSAAGAIFLDARSAGDLSDANSIIFGHRMLGGAMFGALRRYADPAYRQAHPWLYITTDGGVYRYEIFAAYEASVSGAAYRRDITEAELDDWLAQSVLSGQFAVTPADRFLTLSTCTASGSTDTRWVVQAVLRDPAD